MIPAQKLPVGDYQRYGRQMILDGFGLAGQLKLQGAAVVVIGAGGLGCPALQYLAACGVGRIGIIDHDVVEVSNLQRQILHSERTVGMHKALSAAHAIRELNSGIEVEAIVEALQPSNAVELLTQYDVILDCTDNAPTRYLISDTAVFLGKPLVSGAAQKYDGQLCTYNLGKEGPCYRCLFPTPPAVGDTGTCEESGILGVVTGIIGNLQALETLKIITGQHSGKPSLLLFSALGLPQFRSIRLRPRRIACLACGQDGQNGSQIYGMDYLQFCGGAAPDWEQQGLLEGKLGSRIHAAEFKDVLDSGVKVNIIDVRPRTEFDICQLEGSLNVPLSELVADPVSHYDESIPTYVICRLGNDSQIAAAALRGIAPNAVIKDVVGGLKAWARDVDARFPVY